MNYPEITSFNQLEVPAPVKHILQKLDGEQIVRGKKEIAEQLELIQNKVKRVLDCSREIPEIETQSDLSLKRHGDEKQQRTVILEKLTNILNSSMLIQWNLEQVLLWLSGICSCSEGFVDEDTEVNTDEWIIDKEKELSRWLDFILQCLAKLTNVFSINSNVEDPTVQHKKGDTKDGFSRRHKEKHNGKLLAKIKDITALSLEKMFEDEEMVILKSTELLELLQDHITSPYCNKADSTVFQYIMQIFSTLSKAFSLRSKEFHEMEIEVKAKEAQEVNLNANFTVLYTKLRSIQENRIALEMRLHTAEARYESSILASRQHMAHIDKEPSKLVDRSQQCDQVQCTDSETQTLGLMNTGELEGDYIPPTDLQNDDMIYINKGSENIKIFNEEHLEENTHVAEFFEFCEILSTEKDSSQHAQSSKDSSLVETDTNNLPQSPQSHELDIKVEIQVKQEKLGECIQEHENMFSHPTYASEVCDLTGVPLSVSQEQPMATNLDFCGQTDDETDHLMAVKEFQHAVHYLLDQKLSCVAITNEEIMKQNVQENVMLNNLHPTIQRLYKETKAKIEDTFGKVKNIVEQDATRHIQLNDKTTVLPSAVQKTDVSQIPKALAAEFNKVLQLDSNSENLINNSGTSSMNINLPKSMISNSAIPTWDIMNGQQVQRNDIFELHNEEMGPLSEHPESRALEQPSKLNFYSEQMDYDPLSQFEKRDLTPTEQYVTRQGSQHNVMSTDDVNSTDHYFMDVRSQRTNLKMLNEARIMRTVPQHLQSHATDLILQASEIVLTRLGNLFHKYIAFNLIQSVRNNIRRRISKRTHRGRENDIMELQLFLRKLDGYQRKIFQRWADKGAHAEKERSNCLHAMVSLCEKIGNEHELHPSCPRLLQKKEEGNEEESHYSSPDRFITWRVSQPAKSSIISEKGRNVFHSSRKPVNGNAESIWKMDICDKSFQLGKKQSLSLWPTLGVFPETPRLLELDVSLPKIRALRCVHTKDKYF